ncbi:hypothetical protein SRB5_40330 [Streptomyces sp. RB5]|uniref:DUF5753 domain-containing protein n=2 Tax=Streptomyces smaragdinus TaxID=2585196 RepID=A0A7K0CK61_9ACTN|nr:hypothetical protein [Streptomyces smaragdinus]
MFDTHFNSDDLFQELLDLAHDNMIAEYSRSFVEQEKDAVRIQVFTSSSIPGLLQIEEYTRECFRLDPTAEATNELDARVTARMSRQRLFNGDSPPHYWAIIDETALKRPTASRDTMRAQLDHLLKMAEKPHISIQVLPFSQALHPMLGGSLTLLTLRNGSTVALVESFASGEPVESPQKVLELVERFDIGRSKALPASESLKLIRSYLKGYADEPCQHS